MQRFIITESEKNNIREMYGMLKEQIKPKKQLPVKSKGVLIDGIVYNLPQIINQNELSIFIMIDYFLSKSMNEIIKIFGNNTKNQKFFVGKIPNIETDGELKSINPKTGSLYLSEIVLNQYGVISGLLRLNAITGQKTPIPLEQAKILSKQFKSNDQDISTQLNTLNDNLDILVKYGLYSDVFNYYSKLLASRLKNT